MSFPMDSVREVDRAYPNLLTIEASGVDRYFYEWKISLAGQSPKPETPKEPAKPQEAVPFPLSDAEVESMKWKAPRPFMIQARGSGLHAASIQHRRRKASPNS